MDLVSLVPRPDPEVRARRVAAALFGATALSVYLVNLIRWQEGPGGAWRALSFTAALMSILLAHELGHYAVARAHGFRLSLPWFLPFPLLVGTLGALIRLEDRPRGRTGLLEMGVAGPLAGLGAVLVVLVLRLIVGVDLPETDQGWHLARPALWWLLSWPIAGQAPPLVSPLDPLAFAAWLGCLLTAMNLLPLGQLDGGHVLHALWPRRSSLVGWVVTGALVLGGLWWPGWAVWAAAVHLMGARRPVKVRDPEPPPSRRARWLAGAAVVAWVLCFTPAPLVPAG